MRFHSFCFCRSVCRYCLLVDKQFCRSLFALIIPLSFLVTEIRSTEQAKARSSITYLLSALQKVLCWWSGYAFLKSNYAVTFMRFLCLFLFIALQFLVVLLQQLYARFSELLGIHDHLLLLNVIMSKIATNLKCYTEVKFISSCSFAIFMVIVSLLILHFYFHFRVTKSLITP